MRHNKDIEAQKKNILENTLQLIQSLGIVATGFSQIAEKAGVSKTTIVRLFGGKDGLFLETGRYYFREYCRTLEGFREKAEEDPATALSLYLESLTHSGRKESMISARLSQMLYKTQVIPERASGKLKEVYRNFMKPAVTMLEFIIAQGVAQGKFQPVIQNDTLPFLIYALARGISFISFFPFESGEAAETEKTVKERIFELLGVQKNRRVDRS
ncbi:MAG: TetR family transcriptional regulator [Spirochaetales bacterium]|nr:TetR family transcriptional regulator [Spirochaetales bacterium]